VADQPKLRPKRPEVFKSVMLYELAGNTKDRWIHVQEFRMNYHVGCESFQILDIDVWDKGKGYFTYVMLPVLKEVLPDHGIEKLYVCDLINTRFAEYLERNRWNRDAFDDYWIEVKPVRKK
jgi:hypothetical protein